MAIDNIFLNGNSVRMTPHLKAAIQLYFYFDGCHLFPQSIEEQNY